LCSIYRCELEPCGGAQIIAGGRYGKPAIGEREQQQTRRC
jgi:hypothetical protein